MTGAIANNIAVLMTGHELMTGEIIDTNFASIAESFAEMGLSISEKITVGDDLNLLTEQIKRLTETYSIVVINGGLGPTSDDLTSEALSQALNQSLVKNEKAVQHLKTWLKKQTLSASNLKQALLPKEAVIFDNAQGSATGYSLVKGNTLIMTTPGVPKELRHLLKRRYPALIKAHSPNNTTLNWHRITLFGIAEAALQETVANSILTELPIEIGYRAEAPYIEFKYRFIKETDKSTQRKVQQLVVNLTQAYFVGFGSTTIAAVTSQVIKKAQLTLSLAESCTGVNRKPAGQNRWRILFLEGGIVCYSNKMKTQSLQIPNALIEQYGAVSKQVAERMLKNIIKLTKTDVGIAVTGIAGPNGGSKQKPVGTVYIAFGETNNPQVVKLNLPYTRDYFQLLTASISLDCLRHYIVEKKVPEYLRRWQQAN